MQAIGSIPRSIAIDLCATIRAENTARWYSPLAWRCWFCTRADRDGLPGLIEGRPGCTGCARVTERYLREYILPEIVG